MTKKTVGTITIDNERNDDWIRSLSGYADEVEIIEAAAKPKKLRLKVTKKKKKL